MKRILITAIAALVCSCSTSDRMIRLVGGRFDVDQLRAMPKAEIDNLISKSLGGDKYAAYKVAIYYGDDHATYVKWLRIASGLGSAPACDCLASIYARDHNPSSLTAAAYWMRQSVKLGNPITKMMKLEAEEIASAAPELRSGLISDGLLDVKGGASPR